MPSCSKTSTASILRGWSSSSTLAIASYVGVSEHSRECGRLCIRIIGVLCWHWKESLSTSVSGLSVGCFLAYLSKRRIIAFYGTKVHGARNISFLRVARWSLSEHSNTNGEGWPTYARDVVDWAPFCCSRRMRSSQTKIEKRDGDVAPQEHHGHVTNPANSRIRKVDLPNMQTRLTWMPADLLRACGAYLGSHSGGILHGAQVVATR